MHHDHGRLNYINDLSAHTQKYREFELLNLAFPATFYKENFGDIQRNSKTDCSLMIQGVIFILGPEEEVDLFKQREGKEYSRPMINMYNTVNGTITRVTTTKWLMG